MKTITLTPDELRAVAHWSAEWDSPAARQPALDFLHETVRNADDRNEACLVLDDAADILVDTASEFTRPRQVQVSPKIAVERATELNLGEGATVDEQLVTIAEVGEDRGRAWRVQRVANWLRALVGVLYVSEDDEG